MKNNTSSPTARARTGRLAAIIGILCNLVLFAGKLLAGTLSGAVSIVADAFNNLSDASGSIVTLVGFRLSVRPPDAKHPYGHARYEYIAGMVVAALILVMGFELGKSSFEKILSPAPTELSLLTVIILCVSVLLKLGLFVLNRTLAVRIDSTALRTTALDSRNDALITCAVLAAAIIERFTAFSVDGYIGLAVALFIFLSGIKLVRETIDPLLGTAGSAELREKLVGTVLSHPEVLGIHDLLVHDYGPRQCFASLHVEMDSDSDPVTCHDIIDRIEQDCLAAHNVHLVIHHDPIVTRDPEYDRLCAAVGDILLCFDDALRMHDLRISADDQGTVLTFDIALPDRLRGEKDAIRRFVDVELVRREGDDCRAVITFDPPSQA